MDVVVSPLSEVFASPLSAHLRASLHFLTPTCIESPDLPVGSPELKETLIILDSPLRVIFFLTITSDSWKPTKIRMMSAYK